MDHAFSCYNYFCVRTHTITYNGNSFEFFVMYCTYKQSCWVIFWSVGTLTLYCTAGDNIMFPFLAVTIYVKKEEEKVYNALMLDSLTVSELSEVVMKQYCIGSVPQTCLCAYVPLCLYRADSIVLYDPGSRTGKFHMHHDFTLWKHTVSNSWKACCYRITCWTISFIIYGVFYQTDSKVAQIFISYVICCCIGSFVWLGMVMAMSWISGGPEIWHASRHDKECIQEN